jgi:hypothetical protein
MNSKSTALVSTAFALFFGVAHADGGDYTLPTAAPSHEPAYKATTCAEKAQAVWFGRQLQLSEGDVTPSVATTRCDNDNLVQASDE